MQEKEPNPLKQVGRYLGLATLLPACVVTGYGIGYLLDHSLGTTWVKTAGLGVGIVAGLVQIVRAFMKEPES